MKNEDVKDMTPKLIKDLGMRFISDKSRQRVNIGSFKTIEEAVQARDNYIIENKLPHKLSTDYVKETK